MSAYIDVQVEVGIHDVWENMDSWERENFLDSVRPLPEERDFNLENPIRRLELITALRQQGYTVEPS